MPWGRGDALAQQWVIVKPATHGHPFPPRSGGLDITERLPKGENGPRNSLTISTTGLPRGTTDFDTVWGRKALFPGRNLPFGRHLKGRPKKGALGPFFGHWLIYNPSGGTKKNEALEYPGQIDRQRPPGNDDGKVGRTPPQTTHIDTRALGQIPVLRCANRRRP
ncbi:MAG: hypothetical protein CM15mP74_24580 [Halieaceae bacterium]|nr:MAG: hypothetical protein CM15mP74_24580 [Halieaceae bacterium]